MSEDKFFQMVQGKLENFSPEVPQSAYAGMRRKYALSKFMSWNASRLNVWYALLLVGMTSAAIVVLNSNSTESAAQAVTSPVESPVAVVVPKQLVQTEQLSCSNKSTKQSKNFVNFIVPSNHETDLLIDPAPTPIAKVAEGLEENIPNQDTPKIEEIVKAKEEPVKPKTILTIPVYEQKDK
jgi:hypothetical protein